MMFTAQEMNDEAKTYLDYIHRQFIPARYDSFNKCNIWIASRIKTTVSALVAIRNDTNKTIPAHVYANLKELYFEVKRKTRCHYE